MRKSLREQLQTDASSLTQPQAAYGREIAGASGAAARRAAGRSSRPRRALKQIEDNLESA